MLQLLPAARSRRARPLPALAALLFLYPLCGSAEVLDAAPGGFTVEHRAVVPVSRAVAWGTTIDGVSRWWSADHTVSGDAANLYISAEPMGCFCERLGDAGGLVHMTVTFVNPGVILRLTGGLGPLGLMGVSGNLTLEFEELAERPEHTAITLRYAVGGYRAGGLDTLAAPVDAVLGEQLASLAALAAADRGRH